MRYIMKQNGRYYFRRKIPKTIHNYTFSLNTKNVKIALKKVACFLRYSEHVFIDLKYLSKEEVMSSINEIQEILRDYKQKALIEYSELEEARHNDFLCEKKNGSIQDGGHPKCIKKWLKTLKEAVFSKQNDKYLELFERIYQRTGIDKAFFENLSEQEKRFFRIELLKTEAKILKADYERAKQRFDTDSGHPSFNMEQNQSSLVKNKFYEKTAIEIANDFYIAKKNDTKELHKYKEPIEIFLQVTNRKYLADITTEDMQDFIYTIKHMPPKTSKQNIELMEKHKDNYFELAKLVDSESLEKVSLKTALEKIRRVNMYLDYAVIAERLDKNRLNNKYTMPSKAERERIADMETQQRDSFKNEELNALFSSSWYTTRLQQYLKNEQDRIYIPLIGLFTGMRLNEIAQLYVNDIQEEEGIYFFRVDKVNPNQKLKNLRSRRIVPIHSKLIELGFLKYVEKLKEENQERVFPQLFHTANKGYGQAFSKKFNNMNFKKEWISKEKLEDKKIKVDFHSFRHTFSTRIAGKIEDSMVDKLMGHAGSSENKKRYTHAEPKFLKECIEKLDIEGVNLPSI